MGHLGAALEPAARRVLTLADILLKDIRAEDFGRQPSAPGGGIIRTNHPAFVYGHLAIYPTRILEFMGRDGAALVPTEKYTNLFAAGKECLHDPERSIYPPMDEIVGSFKRGHDAVLAALGSVDDDAFSSETPHEGMRARFPTVGSAVTFLVCAHTMMHLGQVSAWRRCMGLGSAM